MKKLLALFLVTAFGTLTVNAAGMTTGGVEHQNNEVTQDFLETNFDGVELPENWTLVGLWNRYNKYKSDRYNAFTFWGLVAIAKQFKEFDVAKLEEDRRKLVNEINEYIRNRSTHEDTDAVRIKKNSTGKSFTFAGMLFEDIVRRFGSAKEIKTIKSQEEEKTNLSRIDLEKAIELAETIKNNICSNKLNSDFQDEEVKQPTQYEEFAYQCLNEISHSFAQDNDYGKDDHPNWEELALIRGIERYLQDPGTRIKSERYAIMHPDAHLSRFMPIPKNKKEESISRATLFFEHLIYRYGSLEDIELVNDVWNNSKVFSQKDIRQLAANVTGNIKYCYARARETDVLNRAVGKIRNGTGTATGTLITYEGMPKELEGRVVLTAAHCLLNQPLTFKGKSICCSSYYEHGEIGIGILKSGEKITNDETFKIKQTNFKDENDIPGLYSIGYGGWALLDNIEFGRKKATMQYRGALREDGWGLPAITDNQSGVHRSASCVFGDSGSPVICNIEGNEEIVAIVSALESMEYLDKGAFEWIKAFCERVAKAERDEENRNMAEAKRNSIKRTKSIHVSGMTGAKDTDVKIERTASINS